MNLLVFGHGYTSAAFLHRLEGRLGGAVATVRSPDKAARLAQPGLAVRVLSDEAADPAIPADIAAADAILVSVPPGPAGDPVLQLFEGAIAAAPRLRWLGYLSTVGVYGDHDGAPVDENAPTRPKSARSVERLAAERAWLALGERSGKAVAVFRLAGIYGPGRGPFFKVRAGTAQRIVKPGQVMNRIHVDDIAAVLEASLDRPRPGAIYNVADDEPAPPGDVVAFAADLAGVPPPPEVDFATADLSPMARSFYGENKRVLNGRVRDELGVRLAYPTYREGLRAVAAAEGFLGCHPRA